MALMYYYMYLKIGIFSDAFIIWQLKNIIIFSEVKKSKREKQGNKIEIK